MSSLSVCSRSSLRDSSPLCSGIEAGWSNFAFFICSKPERSDMIEENHWLREMVGRSDVWLHPKTGGTHEPQRKLPASALSDIFYRIRIRGGHPLRNRDRVWPLWRGKGFRRHGGWTCGRGRSRSCSQIGPRCQTGQALSCMVCVGCPHTLPDSPRLRNTAAGQGHACGFKGQDE